jgi:hypothetical protein
MYEDENSDDIVRGCLSCIMYIGLFILAFKIVQFLFNI